MNNEQLRDVLCRLTPDARSELRRLLYSDQRDRDVIAEQLLRRQTPGATDLADLVDSLSIDDHARRKVVRLLGEIEASERLAL
jgi:hypothetical protein